jgi:glycosyltransferase involved in cell wall biosynthesis
MDSLVGLTSVLIPAYNAGTFLEELVIRLRRSVGDIQIIVVDDGSADTTAEIARLVGATILRHDRNRGKGAALQTGFDYLKKQSDVEFIITLDADLQHQPEDIQKFFNTQRHTGADIVIGWRERTGTKMPMHRIFSNTLTSALVSFRTGMKIKDSQCGFRLIRKSVLDSLQLETDGYEAETELLIKAARLKFKIEFVPVCTIYGAEKSYMTHWATTMNFIKVLFRKYS